METKGSSLLIGYLYFIQGLICSLPVMIVLTYPQLPSYSILSLFSAAHLPYSLKFLTAPFVETYTSLSYGRRKTWIVVGNLLAATLLFIVSYLTGEEWMRVTAILFFLIVFFLTLQDISTDALGVKELKAERASFLQACMQQVGSLVGSLLFMKLISQDFAHSIGLSKPIMTVSQFFQISALLTIIPTIYIHFKYKEKLLDDEKHVHKQGIIDIVKQYRIFFNLKYKMTRQALVFFLYLHGITFFTAGYEYQMIRHGFSKESLTTIRNLTIFPVMMSTFYFSKSLAGKQWGKIIHRTLIMRISTQIIIYLFSPQHYATIFIATLVLDLLMMENYILDCNRINSFPATALSGMFITALNSSRNLGISRTFELWLIGKLGFEICFAIGIAMMVTIILLWSKITSWIDAGTDIQKMYIPQENSVPKLEHPLHQKQY